MSGVEQKRRLKRQRAAISRPTKGRTRHGTKTEWRGETPQPSLPANWYECERGEGITWENRRVRSELVCFGEVMYQPGGTSGPRAQHNCQLVFLHSGTLLASVDGEMSRLSPGEVGLFLPGKTEMFHFSETLPSHHSWLSVASSLVSADLRQRLETARRHVICDQVQARLLAAGLALDRADSDVARSIVDHLGLALLTAYAKAATEPVDNRVVAKAIRYMEQHFVEEGCLQNAHVAADVSRNTLISRFRSQLGTTPARYLWRLRAERGTAMLAETGCTVAEIAYACGFGDPSHFSRLVKKLQGVSPQHLRRSLWSGEPAQAAISGAPRRPAKTAL
jgi:AraC-like DNA-binding protein